MIRIVYFARLREKLGCAEEEIEWSDRMCDTAQLLAFLRSRGEPWSSELGSEKPFLVAVNQSMAAAGTPISDRDEVAIFPPVTGG